MFEKIRGQLRHVLTLLGAIIAAKYINVEDVDTFKMTWELLIAVVMIVGPMVDSWITKRKNDE